MEEEKVRFASVDHEDNLPRVSDRNCSRSRNGIETAGGKTEELFTCVRRIGIVWGRKVGRLRSAWYSCGRDCLAVDCDDGTLKELLGRLMKKVGRSDEGEAASMTLTFFLPLPSCSRRSVGCPRYRKCNWVGLSGVEWCAVGRLVEGKQQQQQGRYLAEKFRWNGRNEWLT